MPTKYVLMPISLNFFVHSLKLNIEVQMKDNDSFTKRHFVLLVNTSSKLAALTVCIIASKTILELACDITLIKNRDVTQTRTVDDNY